MRKIKYLGVILNGKFFWIPHIQQICNRLSSAFWGLDKLRDCVDIPTLKAVYYCLVYPHLQYCITSWGLVSTTALNS